MLVSIFIAMSTILATSQAGLPETCHTIVYPSKLNPLACALTTRGEINAPGLKLDKINWGIAKDITTDQQAETTDSQETVYNDLLKSWVTPSIPETYEGLNVLVADGNNALIADNLPGACRWDLERSNKLGSDKACMCPATEATCTLGRSGCWWYSIPADTAHYSPTFACINTAERFYHLLSKLLKKRGKKDFAIKIRYGAHGARGSLPFGVYGPAIIGGGKAHHAQMAQQIKMQQMKQQQMQQQQKQQQQHYNPYQSYGQSYGQPYGQAQYQQHFGQAQQQQSFGQAQQQQSFGQAQQQQSFGQASRYY